LRLYLLNIASNNSDNNSGRISIKNIGGRIATSDDLINIRRRILKIIETGKLPKETDLAAFYASDKNKIMIENKLKKTRKKAQLLVIMDQPAI
jgi:hypothetical protein